MKVFLFLGLSVSDDSDESVQLVCFSFALQCKQLLLILSQNSEEQRKVLVSVSIVKKALAIFYHSCWVITYWYAAAGEPIWSVAIRCWSAWHEPCRVNWKAFQSNPSQGKSGSGTEKRDTLHRRSQLSGENANSQWALLISTIFLLWSPNWCKQFLQEIRISIKEEQTGQEDFPSVSFNKATDKKQIAKVKLVAH